MRVCPCLRRYKSVGIWLTTARVGDCDREHGQASLWRWKCPAACSFLINPNPPRPRDTHINPLLPPTPARHNTTPTPTCIADLMLSHHQHNVDGSKCRKVRMRMPSSRHNRPIPPEE